MSHSEHRLVLFKHDACGFCQRVLRWLDGRDIEIELRDTLRDREAREELIARTGRSQVPCLFIDGEPLFESLDILRWLEEHHGDGTGGRPTLRPLFSR